MKVQSHNYVHICLAQVPILTAGDSYNIVAIISKISYIDGKNAGSRSFVVILIRLEIHFCHAYTQHVHSYRLNLSPTHMQTLPNDESVPATACNRNKSKNRFANISPCKFLW